MLICGWSCLRLEGILVSSNFYLIWETFFKCTLSICISSCIVQFRFACIYRRLSPSWSIGQVLQSRHTVRVDIWRNLRMLSSTVMSHLKTCSVWVRFLWPALCLLESWDIALLWALQHIERFEGKWTDMKNDNHVSRWLTCAVEAQTLCCYCGCSVISFILLYFLLLLPIQLSHWNLHSLPLSVWNQVQLIWNLNTMCTIVSVCGWALFQLLEITLKHCSVCI